MLVGKVGMDGLEAPNPERMGHWSPKIVIHVNTTEGQIHGKTSAYCV